MAPGSSPPIPEEVRIPGAYGITLEGILQVPGGEPRGAVVLCHPHPGMGGTMRTPLVTRVALGLVRSGRAVLRFNFRGVGESGGAQTDGELEPLDVAAALDFTRSRLGIARPALVGWSFGALMAVAHARTDPDLEALLAVAPPLGMMDPPDTGSVAAPTLWVVGDRDPLCPPTAIDAVRGEHQVIRGANHFFWAKEDSLIATIVDFLDRSGDPASS
jgi:uncharacterized protein